MVPDVTLTPTGPLTGRPGGLDDLVQPLEERGLEVEVGPAYERRSADLITVVLEVTLHVAEILKDVLPPVIAWLTYRSERARERDVRGGARIPIFGPDGETTLATVRVDRPGGEVYVEES